MQPRAPNLAEGPWARMRLHGPCMVFDWHSTEEAARLAIAECASKLGNQVYKFQTVAYFPSRETGVNDAT